MRQFPACRTRCPTTPMYGKTGLCPLEMAKPNFKRPGALVRQEKNNTMTSYSPSPAPPKDGSANAVWRTGCQKAGMKGYNLNFQTFTAPHPSLSRLERVIDQTLFS